MFILLQPHRPPNPPNMPGTPHPRAFAQAPSHIHAPSVQFSSIAQLCLTLCDPMNCSTPGLPVPHQLPEFAHSHVHWVSDAIQPSHLSPRDSQESSPTPQFESVSLKTLSLPYSLTLTICT